MSRPNTTESFWDRVDRSQPDCCWLWNGYRQKRGYGVTSWHGKIFLAHRVALALVDGEWDSPLRVLHTCDNPPCCNPAHLWRGSQLENVRDCIAKGRAIHARGEAVNLARLTPDKVIEIKQSDLSYTALAKRYGVGKTTIASIRRGRTWRHLQ